MLCLLLSSEPCLVFFLQAHNQVSLSSMRKRLGSCFALIPARLHSLASGMAGSNVTTRQHHLCKNETKIYSHSPLFASFNNPIVCGPRLMGNQNTDIIPRRGSPVSFRRSSVLEAYVWIAIRMSPGIIKRTEIRSMQTAYRRSPLSESRRSRVKSMYLQGGNMSCSCSSKIQALNVSSNPQ